VTDDADHLLDPRLRPPNLTDDDLALVPLLIERWEARKILGAVRNRRKDRANQAARNALTREYDAPHENVSAVDAAALYRFEQTIVRAIDGP
jgi:hypothetical protein